MLVTSCPYCITNFEDSRLNRDDGDVIEIKDITEIVRVRRKAMRTIEKWTTHPFTAHSLTWMSSRPPRRPTVGDVMVVGGGISGIQAALDLATAGFKVYLVEKLPTIGGKMSQLDKTFPTNDCSMCIESPKFIECDRHPNIEILTYTEVESVEGEAGDFTVTLTKKPRYVIEDRCTGCGTCVEYCPVKVKDPYNQELSDNKAVHIYFSQAVPLGHVYRR